MSAHNEESVIISLAAEYFSCVIADVLTMKLDFDPRFESAGFSLDYKQNL